MEEHELRELDRIVDQLLEGAITKEEMRNAFLARLLAWGYVVPKAAPPVVAPEQMTDEYREYLAGPFDPRD